jgi:imidazole glycerol-phosphate synthase subunit HisH
MLLIVNTGTSNLQSVANAFRRVGADPTISADPADLRKANAVILPGVGAFEEAMSKLRQSQLIDPIRRAALIDRLPLLGICLGMQLIADRSEELGSHIGLGLIPGDVVRLEPDVEGYRVPNFGWHETSPVKPCALFGEDRSTRPFYFAHSYHFKCRDPDDVAATIPFGTAAVTVAVSRGDIFGVQFHPEKSQDAGLDVLANFVAAVRKSGRSI